MGAHPSLPALERTGTGPPVSCFGKCLKCSEEKGVLVGQSCLSGRLAQRGGSVDVAPNDFASYFGHGNAPVAAGLP